MSDDSFIREVEEELRSDRMKSVWSRYGKYIIAGAVGIVLITAGYRGWIYYQETVASKSGDAFLQAIALSNDNRHDEAIVALEALGKTGSGQYPALAKIRVAAEYAKQGDPQKAVEAFDTIANDTGFDRTLRNVASLRAGLLLVDHGTYDQVADRLEKLSGDGNAFRHSAREGLGLSAWKEKKFRDSYRWFNAVANDQGTPSGVRARTDIMLELLAGKGIPSAS